MLLKKYLFNYTYSWIQFIYFCIFFPQYLEQHINASTSWYKGFFSIQINKFAMKSQVLFLFEIAHEYHQIMHFPIFHDFMCFYLFSKKILNPIEDLCLWLHWTGIFFCCKKTRKLNFKEGLCQLYSKIIIQSNNCSIN